MSFSVSIFISAMLRLGAGGVPGSFSFSLLFFFFVFFLFVCFWSGGGWRRGTRGYRWRGGRSRNIDVGAGVSDVFVGGAAGGKGYLYTNDNQMFFFL